MIKKINIFILLLFLASTLYSEPDSINRYFIEAAQKAKPSVVSIVVYSNTIEKGRQVLKQVAMGSGTIITKKGLVVTNRHVLLKGNFYRISINNGTEFSTKNFSHNIPYLDDPKTDIALIQIYNPDNIIFSPLKFEDSNNLMEGEWVLAIGSPYGLRQTITSGIVSSTGRDSIGFTNIEDFIQTDVPLNPGNSGGPLVNLYGKMVGLNTAIQTNTGGYQGISFSIPSNIVRHIVTDLVQYHRVRRGWIGFLASEKVKGSWHFIEILSVIKNSPAQEAGLRQGDIIKTINGEKVFRIGTLLRLIGNKPVGTSIDLTVSRRGKILRAKLILREKESYRLLKKVQREILSRYGFEIDEYTGEHPVIITYVSPRSYSKGIKPGDILLEINRKVINSFADLAALLKAKSFSITTLTILRNKFVYRISM